MAFEDLLKNFSILNQEPWNRPPEFPTPEVAPIVRGTDFTPMVRDSLAGGAGLIEPDMKAAKSRASQNVGPALFLLPLMLAGTKNKKKGLAAFARALNQSVGREMESQSALEVWRADQLNSRRAAEQKALLEEIKQGRTMMEKIAELDPLLWTDEGFVDAWLSGDVTYLPRSGWKLQGKKEKKSYQVIELGGRKVVFDPQEGITVRDLGPAKAPGSGKAVDPLAEKLKTIKAATLEVLQAKGPEALTPIQVEIAKDEGWLSKEWGKPNAKLETINGVTVLFDHSAGKVLQSFPEIGKAEKGPKYESKVVGGRLMVFNPETGDYEDRGAAPQEPEKPKAPSRADADSMTEKILGGTDFLGRTWDGMANQAKTPEELEGMLHSVYGTFPELLPIAYNIAFGYPKSKFFGKQPGVKSVAPAPVASQAQAPQPQGSSTFLGKLGVPTEATAATPQPPANQAPPASGGKKPDFAAAALSVYKNAGQDYMRALAEVEASSYPDWVKQGVKEELQKLVTAKPR